MASVSVRSAGSGEEAVWRVCSSCERCYISLSCGVGDRAARTESEWVFVPPESGALVRLFTLQEWRPLLADPHAIPL